MYQIHIFESLNTHTRARTLSQYNKASQEKKNQYIKEVIKMSK